jgi:hypothetical protein
MAQTWSARDAIDPDQTGSGPTHASTGDDEEEDEDGFNLVIEREVDDKRVYRIFVGRDATLARERIGDDQDCVSGSERYYEERHTQMIQMVMIPFMSRLRWVIALALGWPPLRADGGGSFRTL